jgi:DNA-binding transcriptional LysR family regulator
VRFSGLSIRQLEAFDMIMRTGSVSSAAIALHISQPSVSRLLQDLERDTGLDLFDRGKGRLVPTAQAMMFHEEVAGSFRSARELMAVAQSIRELKKSRLRIGALAAASLELIPTVIRQFKAKHPGAIANVSVRSSPNIVADVAAQRLDIGVIDGGVAIFDTIQVGSFRFPSVCAMDVDHRLTAKEKISAADLKQYPFVSLGSEYMARTLNGRVLHDELQNNIEVETFQSFLACGFVVGSEAVAIIDPFTAHFYSKMGLVSRPLEKDIPFELAIVVNHRSKSDNGVQAFIRVLSAQMSECFGDS